MMRNCQWAKCDEAIPGLGAFLAGPVHCEGMKQGNFGTWNLLLAGAGVFSEPSV
jgi:hypothetical protein